MKRHHLDLQYKTWLAVYKYLFRFQDFTDGSKKIKLKNGAYIGVGGGGGERQ